VNELAFDKRGLEASGFAFSAGLFGTLSVKVLGEPLASVHEYRIYSATGRKAARAASKRYSST
jgi:hypothetical protein